MGLSDAGFEQLLANQRAAIADAPKPRKPRSRPERDIEVACARLLELDGWRALKTDPVRDLKRMKLFGEIGMADTLMLRYKENATKIPDLYMPWAEVLWLEWKSPTGKPSQKQREWHAQERLRGAMTLIAGEDFPASVDGFWDWYRKSGLWRKRV